MILSEAEVRKLEKLAKSNWSGDPLTAAKSLLSLIGSHEELRRERDRLREAAATTIKNCPDCIGGGKIAWDHDAEGNQVDVKECPTCIHLRKALGATP